MATITLEGFDELGRMFDRLGEIPAEVLTAALDGMGEAGESAIDLLERTRTRFPPTI